MSKLPGPMSFADFEMFRRDPSRWLAAAADIARAHALPASDLHVFANGSNLVVGLDARLILKIFPPMLRHQFESEAASLAALRGKLSVPVPEVVVEGERDGWHYLVMTRLGGATGEVVWPALDEGSKERILGQIGGLIAEVQRIPATDLAHLEPRWNEFLPRQIAACRERHARLGLARKFFDSMDSYLAEAAAILPSAITPVILTGEFIPENLLMTEDADGWRISGLIDFGDVMTGWGEYDLLGPSVFMGCGERGRIRALLRGYGYPDAQLGPALSRRLMTLFLLHRYSDPARQIRIDGWQDKAGSLQELERLIWPI